MGTPDQESINSAIYWAYRHNMLFFEKQRHLLAVKA
jgi:hypothetical protein